MDGSRFDALLRVLVAPGSRRRLTQLLSGLALSGPLALLGLAETDAKHKKHKKHKRRAVPCVPVCAGKVCGDDGCGGTCGVACTNGRICQDGTCRCPNACCVEADCAAGQLCAQGQCVTGQGTCAGGADACVAITPTCGAPACYCSTRDGITRCGHQARITDCNSCTTDADCAALHPEFPGIFCTTGSADRCECQNFCRIPCPG